MRCGGMCRLYRPSRYVLMTRSSEGVQIGGVRSSYGVLGSWTTVHHEIHDPVGMYETAGFVSPLTKRVQGHFGYGRFMPPPRTIQKLLSLSRASTLLKVAGVARSTTSHCIIHDMYTS